MRILAADANGKGDLFGRLVTDLFDALGYTDSRLNIHKTGREIDIAAVHRLESRRAIGECKALERPVGGADLNKFAGVLQLEAQGAKGEQVQGYFLSLAGFTESAREQEEKADSPRFVLLTGRDVERELVENGPVKSAEQAWDTAGRLVSAASDVVPEGDAQLLAHDLGWIWLCPYGNNHEISHFALIHADGRPLAQAHADQVIAVDKELGGSLHAWSYLAPAQDATDAQLAEADRRYRQYLLAELGEITLEGLPVDEEAGVRKIALEDLYVPLRVRRAIASQQEERQPSEEDPLPEAEDRADQSYPEEIGAVLERETRIAILADPGSGKSTLVKRLAVAYASEQHRGKVADGLPDSGWLPLFIRCRTLGGDATKTIRTILSQIPERGEFPEVADAFEDLITSSLRTGKVLLLIDGLDEIASAKDRMSFALQLRTFAATYPNVAMVLTSRKAGFRVVGGAVSNICTWFGLDDFDDDDINAMTLAWHSTVIGESEKTGREAQALAETIISTDRVRRLARNPLLLTTLLLVKRWVGDLPRKRPILYEKAIEVLLMTWNVEAHEPIERDEAIPQLAFVAHSMTAQGRQRVSARDLARLLDSAREQMPEILGFARITVSQFIDRIESRSSLLVMTGHEEERGELIPVYEFRHLTFQEYLTAVALVDGYYDGHVDADRLVDQLTPHINDSQWYEVTALANVRAGRSAREVVGKMLELVRAAELGTRAEIAQVVRLLGRSLADEVQLPPELVRDVSVEFARGYREGVSSTLVGEIVESRYGAVFEDSVVDAFADEPTSFAGLASACSEFVRWKHGDFEEGREWATSALAGSDRGDVLRAALWCMRVVFEHSIEDPAGDPQEMFGEYLGQWARDLLRWCEDGSPDVGYGASWALAWIGKVEGVEVEERPRALKALLRLWQTAPNDDAQRTAAWAFCEIPELPREARPLGEANAELREFAKQQLESEPQRAGREDRRPAAVILAYYLGEPWSDEELAALLTSEERTPGSRAHLVANALGVEIPLDLFPLR